MGWYELQHNTFNVLIGFPETEAFMHISLLISQMTRSWVPRSVSYVLALSVVD